MKGGKNYLRICRIFELIKLSRMFIMNEDSFRFMFTRKSIARTTAILLSVIAWSAHGWIRASDGEEGVEVLRNFASEAKLSDGEVILGMAGFFGQPLPPQWLVLTGRPDARGPLRESVCARGNILAERKFSPLPGQDLPIHSVSLDAVKISSRQAFEVAEHRAGDRRIRFESAHFQLRVRDAELEPVWMLQLLNRAQVSVGTLYLSAVDGRILRETWTAPAGLDPVRVSAR